MSDFDKEAERERLREKYEKEREDREVTERMSELLLQGATMTNAHCSDCGDPIFRYDGQEFCPTCEKPVQRDAGGGADAEAADDEPAGEGEHIEVASPGDEARVRFGDDGERPRAGAAEEPPDRPGRPESQADAGGTEPAREVPAGDAGDLERSRAELHRRLRQLSQRAGACEDPRDAEAYLAAAREATEALAALRR